tara:strand:+ start:139 stop:390 length:252 start_codon:yes stop_codon:yes gene_type:complete
MNIIELIFNRDTPVYESQKETVLEYMKKHRKMTSMQAINKYGITRLASHVHTLRNEGYRIDTERVQNARGSHALYRLNGSNLV